MRNFANLTQFSRFTSALSMTARGKCELGLAQVSLQVYETAWELFGDEEALPPPLQESTQLERERKGFAPNETLLRTGSLRDSLRINQDGMTVAVGSDDPRMVWQELGTPRGIPPRPLLRIAARRASPQAMVTFGHFVSAMVGINDEGGGVTYAPTGENIAVPSGAFGGALQQRFHVPGGLYGPAITSRSSSRLRVYQGGSFIRV